MQYSTNYNMNKPELTEQYRLSHWNENTDIIDSNMKRIDDLTSDVENIIDPTFKTALLNFCYPVGSLYWSSNSTDPSTLFGGTWTPIKDCFVWAKGNNDTVNATGGSKTVTLTEQQIPSHTHTFTGSAVTSGGMSANTSHSHNLIAIINGGSRKQDVGAGSPTAQQSGEKHCMSVTDNRWHYQYTTSNSVSIAHTHSVTASGTNSSTGGGQAHDNMPPYIVKYCWERTA